MSEFTPYKGTYSEFHDFNRLQNLDGVEWKILSHLIYSNTKHAKNFWRILKHNGLDSLSQPVPNEEERIDLIWMDNNESEMTNKRLFMQPFVDDAWSEQCSSVYVYVDQVSPKDASRADIVVVVEAVVHSKISVLYSDASDTHTEHNPNDFDTSEQGNIVVPYKNRATVLLKSIIAELNGLYLDGIGYLQLDPRLKDTGAKLSLWNSRSFYGYTIKFGMVMSGVSGDSEDSL